MLYDVLAARLNVDPFRLRRNTANMLTAYDAPWFYFCPIVEKLRHAVMYDEHRCCFRDLVLLSRSGDYSFLLVDASGVIQDAVFLTHDSLVFTIENTLPLSLVSSISSVLLSSVLRSQLFTQSCNPQFDTNDFRSMKTQPMSDNLLIVGGTADLLSLVRRFVFHQRILLHHFDNPMQFLYACCDRSTQLVIGFHVIDRAGKCLFRVGGSVDLLYVIVLHENVWWLLTSRPDATGRLVYTSLHLPILLHSHEPTISHRTIYCQLWTCFGKTTAELCWQNVSKIHCHWEDVHVTIYRFEGIIEVLSNSSCDTTLQQQIMQLANDLPGKFFVQFAHLSSEQVKTRLLSKTSIFDILQPDSLLVLGRERGIPVHVGDAHFLDWRVVYLSESLGYIPDAHNKWLKQVQTIDPADVKPAPKKFLQRWSPGYHAKRKTNINSDFSINSTEMLFVPLRPLDLDEQRTRLPFCPLFLEPNALLDKMDRFEIRKSSYLLKLSPKPSEYPAGLFAKKTLLKDVQYPQLGYYGASLTDSEVVASDSLYIWEFSESASLDGRPCTWSFAKFVNSADYYKDDKYVCDHKRLNVRMDESVQKYIPTKTIVKGDEILTMYGKNYWLQ